MLSIKLLNHFKPMGFAFMEAKEQVKAPLLNSSTVSTNFQEYFSSEHLSWLPYMNLSMQFASKCLSKMFLVVHKRDMFASRRVSMSSPGL